MGALPDLSRAIERLTAMGAAWDEAAARLRERDYAGFDSAMRIFNKVKQS